MQVLEDEHRRTLFRDRLEELPPGREAPGAVAARLSVPAEPDQGPEALEHPRRAFGFEPAHRLGELPLGLLGRVGLEDPGVRLRHLGQRPVGDPLPVGQRAALAPVDQLRLGVYHLRELVDEAALADPGHADEGHELRRAFFSRTREGVPQQVELAPTADERRTGLHDVDAEPGPGFLRLPHGHRLSLPLRGHGLRLRVADHVAGRAIGRLVDEDPVHRRRVLQPGRGVDDVARGHPLALTGASPEGHQRLAGGYGDPHLEPPVLGHRVADGQRGAHRAFWIVLVRGGSAEDGHHRVADELLDGASVALELGTQLFVVGPQDRIDVLGVERLRTRGEANEVGEEHRDDLPLPARLVRHGRYLSRST